MAGNKKPKKRYNPNKLKTNTPITIRYGRAGDHKLKLPPHTALGHFISNTVGRDDWATLNFRIRIGKKLADHFNADSIEVDFDHGLWIMNKANEYYAKTNTWLIAPEHICDIRAILETTDTMQDETTRAQQLDVHYAVQKELKIGKFKVE